MIAQQKRLTLAEFHAISELPEHRDRLYELIDGEMVEKVASFTPSRLAARITRFIGNFADDFGYVTGADGSYILAPGYEVMPDVGYIAKARLPHEPERQVEGAPDLAVEVKSPSDNPRDLRAKAELYLRFGTQMVWLIFPEDRRAEVYYADGTVQPIGIDNALDGGTVLPGFRLPLRDVFGDL